MPAPVDLSQILADAGVPTNLPASMARGVDLRIVRDKKKHQHRWTALARYLIDDDQMEIVMESVEQAQAVGKAQEAAGEEVTGVPIIIPLEQDHQIVVEGPGCLKCGMHAFHPTEGYGAMCPKSDDEFHISEADLPVAAEDPERDQAGDEEAERQRQDDEAYRQHEIDAGRLVEPDAVISPDDVVTFLKS